MQQSDADRSIADSFGAQISVDGLRDYWRVYLDNRPHIESAIRAELMASPPIHALLSPLTRERWDRERRLGTERMERGLGGDWGPYVESLSELGALFAAKKLPFRDWYALPLALSRQVVPLLVEAFHADPDRLARALTATNEYVDASMALLGDAYLKADRDEIERERARTMKHAHALAVSDRLLRKRTAIFEAALGQMSDGVALCIPDGDLPVLNDAARALLQVEEVSLGRPRWLGPRAGAWLLPDGRTPLPDASHPIILGLNGQTAHDLEFIHRVGPDDPPKHILADTSPLYLDDVLVGALVTFRDVTESRRMDLLLERSQELEKQNQLLEAASRLKSEFLANMSHELRTPLNAVLGFSELIRDGVAGPTTSTQIEYLDDILVSGRHLLTLINDVLDLAKVEAGRLQLHPEVVDVSALAREVIAVLRSAAAHRRVELRLVDGEPIKAFLDPSRVRQVLYNYLSNAIKFTPENGRVSVRLEIVEPRAVLIEVEDTGIGIDEADLPRLFREFEQLSRTTTKSARGTGLGLALTRNLVEAMGGTVGVRSVVGKGSTFSAVLPADLHSDEPATKNRSLPGASWDSPRILVVESDPDDQSLLVRMLSEGGYAVVTASTGAQACQMARAETFDAITLDLCLPDSSGLDVLNAIRRDSLNTTTPLVLISISPDDHFAASFAVAGVLSKPLDSEALKRSLVAAGVFPSRQAPVLVVDDDPSLLRLARASLMRLGYASVCFSDPAEALSWLAERRPSAIILDLLMPDIDGLVFLRRLELIPPQKNVPVFLWTVKDLTDAERRVFHERARTVILEGKRTGSSLLRELASVLRSPRDLVGEQ